MFGLTYTEQVTIRRPKAGTLSIGGRTEYEQVKNEGDETPVRIACKIQERGKVTLNAKQTTIKTDATMLYSPARAAVLKDGDIVVRKDGRAYEIVGMETTAGPWGGTLCSRVDLVKTQLQVPGGVA